MAERSNVEITQAAFEALLPHDAGEPFGGPKPSGMLHSAGRSYSVRRGVVSFKGAAIGAISAQGDYVLLVEGRPVTGNVHTLPDAHCLLIAGDREVRLGFFAAGS